ncbi:alpha/beta fold hydrolase [Pelagibacterium halotolerans]|uniref:alpha/beta fold hydrolase n=1 Tax=Pelagibacterium halotolerans TaxID=531813 RepID=UPI00384F873D
MTQPISRYFTLRHREIHVTQWGTSDKPALVMWHGLARTGRDFDTIARALSGEYFILAPDTLGRGLSQWAENPARDYRLDTFGAMAMEMLDTLGIATCRWIGTSMGGAIGMHLAGGSMRERITHLVINDIGPEIPAEAVERISAYVGNPPVFDTIGELEAWLRTVYAPFGTLSDTEWRTMAESSTRRTDTGKVTVHYDPRIVAQFDAKNDVGDQWSDFDAITAPTLLIRGMESDLLREDLAVRMQARGSRLQRLDIPHIGHAPALNVPAQIEPVRAFLRG